MVKKTYCKECHRYHKHTGSKGCPICNELFFSESILCDLTRSGQKKNSLFECEAFKPILLRVSKNNNRSDITKKVVDFDSKNSDDKVKWFLAYAKQQLRFDSDRISGKLLYHVCLSTRKRKRLFFDTNRYIEKLTDILENSKSCFYGTVDLLWLGLDHIHLYIESSPDYSIDEIVNRTIEILEKDLFAIFPTIFKNTDCIWERSYFVETIG